MYGDSSDSSQAFSIAWDTDDYDQFMFASSGLHFFLIADKSEIIGNDGNKYYSPGTIPIIASSIRCNPYSGKTSLSSHLT